MSSEAEDKEFYEELKTEFLSEAMFLLEQCDESCLKLEDESNRQATLDEIFRIFHSIKGGAAAVGFTDLSWFSHTVENCLGNLRRDPDLINSEITTLLFQANDALKERVGNLRQGKPDPWNVDELANSIKAANEALEARVTASAMAGGSSEGVSVPKPTPKKTVEASSSSVQKNTVRVDTQYIDSVLDLIGELVVIKSQLLHSNVLSKSNLRLDGLLSLFDKTVRDLQDRALKMRMTPLKSVFMKAQRQVRELSQKLEKPTSIEITGESTEIDRDLIEQLSDPIVHLIRNALDHGIETKEERMQTSKPETASIRISAMQARGRITIEIRDDGRGIDRNKILKRAVERNLVADDTDVSALSDKEVYDFLFKPGFSTAEKVSDLSGRGVGLDVVKSNLEKMKGMIEIESELGKGTVFRFSIPLTAAIFDGMVVVVGGSHFILSLDKIDEIVQLRKMKTYDVGGRTVVDFRGEMLDLVCLQEAFGMLGRTASPPSDTDVAIIVHFNEQRFALRLQAVVGQTQVVIKPLGEQFSSIPDVSGAAVLGDGKIALIVDTDGIAKRVGISKADIKSLVDSGTAQAVSA